MRREIITIIYFLLLHMVTYGQHRGDCVVLSEVDYYHMEAREKQKRLPIISDTTKSILKLIGAFHAGGHIMIIGTVAAKKLIDKYFKNS